MPKSKAANLLLATPTRANEVNKGKRLIREKETETCQLGGLLRLCQRDGKILLLCALLILAAGCAVLEESSFQEGPRPTAARPQWRLDALEDHLDFFRDALLDERDGQTIPRGIRRRVAEYLAAQMRDAWLQPVFKETYLFPPRAAEEGAPALIGVAGYISGKHPTFGRELVIVCADLAPSPDAELFSIGAAALLELARNYGLFARFSLVPERSVLFAAWLGGPEGLEMYLRAPAWALKSTRAVVYVGLGPARQEEVRALLEPHGIVLYAVSPRQLPYPLPEAGAQEASSEEARAAARAQATARKAHEWILPEVLSRGELLPVLDDTLGVPPAAQQ